MARPMDRFYLCFYAHDSLTIFFKLAQAGGRTWDVFGFCLFSLSRNALDHHLATAPRPLHLPDGMLTDGVQLFQWKSITFDCVNRLKTFEFLKS